MKINKKSTIKDKLAKLYKYFSVDPNLRLIEEYFLKYKIIVNPQRLVSCPQITTYFFKIKKSNQKIPISEIENGIAYLLQAPGGFVRIEISNKNIVVEVPNRTLQPIPLNVLIEKYKKSELNYKLPIMMGIDNKNKDVFADLVELKHLVMAGQTGSGKSVFVNTTIYTLLTLLPNSVKFLFSDAKRVELTPYNGIPQLLTPVILEAQIFFEKIEELVEEKRKRLKSVNKNYPYIVAVFDTIAEFALYDRQMFDRLMSELLIDADKVKIHVIVCDSRPSVNVYTPIFMSLMPTKLCFATASKADSQQIIQSDEGIKLLGRGDVLMQKENENKLTRLETPWVSDLEINELIKKTKENTNRRFLSRLLGWGK